MQIELYNEQDDLSLNLEKIQSLIPLILDLHQIKTDEITLYFVDDPTMCELHEEFFNDPSPTDCMTFPVDGTSPATPGMPHILGEIFVCPLTAIRYTAENGGNPQDELLLYIIHGILHLIGYDDIEEDDRKKMRVEEARTLDHLRYIASDCDIVKNVE
jgi:probable rRNA maturation factor